MRKQNINSNFKLGISFSTNDFDLLYQSADQVLVSRYKESNDSFIKHALETDISDRTLNDIKKQLLFLCDDVKSISEYAHINLIYNCSIIPIAAYLSALEKIFIKNNKKIEVILPFNFIFKSKSSYIFMAEGETRFKFLYSRAECFTYFIEIYCRKNNIPIKYLKKNYIPYFFYPILRRTIAFIGKFLEDVTQNIKSIASKDALNIHNKNVFISRSSPTGFYSTESFNNGDAICLLSESSSFNQKNMIDICNSDKNLFALLPQVSLWKVIKSYLNFSKSINTNDHIDLFDIKIPLKNIYKEINLTKPNLEIYHQRLKKINLLNNSIIFSKELASPQAAIESLYFSSINCDIKFLQTVDLNHRVTPKMVFGGSLIAYSNFHADRIKNSNPEIKIESVETKIFKSIIHSSNNDNVVFFDTEMDETDSRNNVQSQILLYSESVKKNLVICRHPRDNASLLRNNKLDYNKSLAEKLSNASIIFTYPSAIMNEILPYNIPIVILFVGVGRDSKWHWTYDESYLGCISSLDDIVSINDESIREPYSTYSNKLLLLNGFVNE